MNPLRMILNVIVGAVSFPAMMTIAGLENIGAFALGAGAVIIAVGFPFLTAWIAGDFR